MPLRFPRPVTATGAIGLALAWTALGCLPALADQVRGQEWWLAKLHVTQAWQTTKGSGVTVALLDTGVDPSVPDLSGSVLTGKDFTNSGERQGSPFFGVHGTAMASLIVGHGHGPGNTAGIIGVAPGARLLSVRVALDGGDPLLSNSGVTSGLPGAIAAGIRYAVSNGAQVIDLPLDPGRSPSDLVAPAPSPAANTSHSPVPDGTAAEASAVAYALSQGVVLVAPGGDNGAGAPNFPADEPGVISVGAFDSSFVRAPYSSHQPYVTLTAAGAGMTAAVPPGGYATVSSTSAASAVVTGIVALIKSQYPGLTPAQVTRALIRGTAPRPPGGTSDGSGHGTADAARAIAAAAAIAPPGLRRAGAGAVARTPPTAPPASAQSSASLAQKLERDAVISLAVLVVLLLPTVAYALVQRYRRPDRALARAEPEQAARASSDPGGGTADMMREYFATLSGPPGDSRATGGARGPRAPRAPQPGQTGTFGDAGTHLAGTFADPVFAPSDETMPRTGGQIPRSPLAPVTRATVPRPAKVSGTPPWEPAPKPEGELPWTSPPASTALSRRGAHAAPPTSSIWAAAVQASPPPVPHDAQGDPGDQGDLGDLGDRDDRAENHGADDDGADARPIYVWNPSETTETFPQVPREPGS